MSNWVLIAGLLALFGGLTAVIVLAGSLTRERSQIQASLHAIQAISDPVQERMRREYDRPFSERITVPAAAWMASVARTLSGANWARNTAARLDKAGNPPGWDADRILATKTLSALCFATVVAVVLLVSGSPLPALLWGAALGVVGFFLPDLFVMSKAQNRADAIARALPDSIDLLTITVESGLAFDAGLAQVARNTDGPLAQEFTRVLKEIQIGSSRSAALKAMAERTDVEDLRVFLNSMVQAEKLGIPIGDVLRVQSSEMRIKRSQRIEEQAMKLPVKLVFPLLLGVMPALFVVILGPAMISIYQTLMSGP